jgi:hypothetical protein
MPTGLSHILTEASTPKHKAQSHFIFSVFGYNAFLSDFAQATAICVLFAFRTGNVLKTGHGTEE